MISLRDFLDLDVFVLCILALCIWGGKFIGLSPKMIRYLQIGAFFILLFETLREIWVAHHYQTYQKR